MEKYWQSDVQDLAKTLLTDLSNGLSVPEAVLRLEKYGLNQLKDKKGRSLPGIFLEQFQGFIVWVLIGAALVSGFLKEWVDAFAIIGIVVLNAILGFIQEFRAEKSLSALKKLSSPASKIIREGKPVVLPASQLVPGDIIELEAGDNVPADSRLVYLTPNFSVQEASLTGESLPVVKTTLALAEKEVPLAERGNTVYLGTSVSSGKGRALVVETGMDTELGKIAGMIQQATREPTPLQKKLEQFGKWLVYLCLLLVGLIFLIGLVRGGKVIDLFLTAVSLAVAAIPEGLPAVVTIALALGVQRMVKRNALIRKLPSVETLGCATVICTDKTGTLTRNEMTVKAIYAGGTSFQVTGVGYEPTGEFLIDGRAIKLQEYPALKQNLLCGVLCNSASLVSENRTYRIVGDPTEGAILTAAAKADIRKEELEVSMPFLQEIPFDSERKKMTIIRYSAEGGREGARPVIYVKGAPDILLNDCTREYIPSPLQGEGKGEGVILTEARKKQILEQNLTLANQALRVIAVAYRYLDEVPKQYEADNIEKDLIFAGLIAMMDPPRAEARAAITKCKGAGIRTVMITGDHKNTAIAIAKELGFFEEGSLALTGLELDRLDDREFLEMAPRISVYARVSPEHKFRIVSAWRKKGEIVAMTGDGVNDAPAIKEADIGVAMGISGTDVTKEVSDMVITDDNFASIVAAVEEGRGIYDNIRKFIHYLLSCNSGEILVMFTASLAGVPAPLLPVQILWVNLVTDGLPALALGVDPVDPGIMERPPRKTSEGVIDKHKMLVILGQGALIAFCSLLAFAVILFGEKGGIVRARTGAFVVLACSQLFHSFNCRNSRESIFKIGLFTNPKLIIACAISFLLQVVAVYTPFVNRIFRTQPLGFADIVLVLLLSSFPLWAVELVKLSHRKSTSSSLRER
ncbi:MAG: cation-translocating P-type ATPase [Candidatus Ratteibacteria bacterium]|jgi:Ca2+-transporting ATPase